MQQTNLHRKLPLTRAEYVVLMNKAFARLGLKPLTGKDAENSWKEWITEHRQAEKWMEPEEAEATAVTA